MFEYVRNHIDYVPYYGALKGSTLTLLDGSGNDSDQSALLIALLRASGYTADFVQGRILCSMYSRFGLLLFGIFLMAFPLIRFTTGRLSTFWGQPVSPLGDIAVFLFGLFLFLFGVFKPQAVITKRYICPKCEETVERTGTKEVSCPACGTKMEELKGFYERHLDLKS